MHVSAYTILISGRAGKLRPNSNEVGAQKAERICVAVQRTLLRFIDALTSARRRALAHGEKTVSLQPYGGTLACPLRVRGQATLVSQRLWITTNHLLRATPHLPSFDEVYGVEEAETRRGEEAETRLL